MGKFPGGGFGGGNMQQLLKQAQQMQQKFRKRRPSLRKPKLPALRAEVWSKSE